MVNIERPYSYSLRPLLTGGVQLTIFLPAIGKSGKPTIVSTHLVGTDSATPYVAHVIKSEIKNLVLKFINTKQHAFESFMNNQNVHYLNSLSALRHSFSVWSSNEFTQHLKGEILPFMDVLRTANTQSKFYQYDKDVFDFCSAIANKSIVNVSYLV